MDHTAIASALQDLHEESFAWALHCCRRDRVMAEDALQTTYVKVLTGRGGARFDGRSTFKTWLFSVIRRTAADLRRPRFWERWLGTPRDVPSEAADPRLALEEREQQDLLLRALAQLSERQREVLVLVFYHEHTIAEAATIMGVGLGSARTHYARGKSRLRELLDGMGVSHDD